MPRPPHPRRAEAEALILAGRSVEEIVALIGCTPAAVRGWARALGRARGQGQRGPDRGPRAERAAPRAALIAGALLSEPEESAEAIGAALGVSGQRVRQVRSAYLTDGE